MDIPEIRVLVSTDVLAEGLNLQDATCIINYDLHWNPVRLLQRIGRVDRRLDPSVEAKILADHPNTAEVRGIVYLWNFLPPDELNEILSLYERVTHKALRISKTFGIEGRKFSDPADDYEALREFNQQVEGTTTLNRGDVPGIPAASYRTTPGCWSASPICRGACSAAKRIRRRKHEAVFLLLPPAS